MHNPPDPVAAKKLREAIARELSRQHGRPPEELEPGDAYGVDGHMPNGDPAHYNWRRFVENADRILAAITPHLPALTQLPVAGEEAKEQRLDLGRIAYRAFAKSMNQMTDADYPVDEPPHEEEMALNDAAEAVAMHLLSKQAPSAPTNGDAAPSSWAVEALEKDIRQYVTGGVDRAPDPWERDEINDLTSLFYHHFIARHAQPAGEGKDQERLDWLEKNCDDLAIGRDHRGVTIGRMSNFINFATNEPSIRAALDAAMAQEGRQE